MSVTKIPSPTSSKTTKSYSFTPPLTPPPAPPSTSRTVSLTAVSEQRKFDDEQPQPQQRPPDDNNNKEDDEFLNDDDEEDKEERRKEIYQKIIKNLILLVVLGFVVLFFVGLYFLSQYLYEKKFANITQRYHLPSLPPGVTPSKNVCTKSVCAKLTTDIVESLDTSVNPCENFYQYVCGRWSVLHPLEPYQSRLNSHEVLDQKIKYRLHRSMMKQIVTMSSHKSKPTIKTKQQMMMITPDQQLALSYYGKCVNLADAAQHNNMATLVKKIATVLPPGGKHWPLFDPIDIDRIYSDENLEETLLNALSIAIWSQTNAFVTITVIDDMLQPSSSILLLQPMDTLLGKKIYSNDTLISARIQMLQNYGKYFYTNYYGNSTIIVPYSAKIVNDFVAGGGAVAVDDNHVDYDDVHDELEKYTVVEIDADLEPFDYKRKLMTKFVFDTKWKRRKYLLSKNFPRIKQKISPAAFPKNYHHASLLHHRNVRSINDTFTSTTTISGNDNDLQDDDKIQKLNFAMEELAAFERQLIDIIKRCNVSFTMRSDSLRRIKLSHLPPLITLSWEHLLKRFLFNGIGKDLVASALKSTTTVLVKDLCYFEQLPTLIQSTPIEVLYNFLGMHMIERWSSYLQYPLPLTQAIKQYDDVILDKMKVDHFKPRWLHCIEQMYTFFERQIAIEFVRDFPIRHKEEEEPEDVGGDYVNNDDDNSNENSSPSPPLPPKHVPIDEHLRKLVLQEIDKLFTVVGESFRVTKWLDNATQTMAMEKMNAIRKYIGVSTLTRKQMQTGIIDGSILSTNANGDGAAESNDKKLEHFLNMTNLEYIHFWANTGQYRRFVRLAGINVAEPSSAASGDGDKNELGLFTEAIVNAGYIVQLNTITVPLSMLQPPMFSMYYPPTVNSATLIWILAHEIIHAFDDQGRRYGPSGEWTNWWSNETLNRFAKRAACFVHQYNAQGGDGFITLGENIADNGAIRYAYETWKHYYYASASSSSPLHLPLLTSHYTIEQLFFITAAHLHCSNMRPEMEKLLTSVEAHSLPQLRVNEPLKNFPQFARAFQCAKGTPMNPSDDKRCRLW